MLQTVVAMRRFFLNLFGKGDDASAIHIQRVFRGYQVRRDSLCRVAPLGKPADVTDAVYNSEIAADLAHWEEMRRQVKASVLHCEGDGVAGFVVL